MADEQWYTADEIAQRLRVDINTVRRWLRTGRLVGIRLSGKAGWRVRESEVNRFIEELEGKAAA
jgi:excisionase family DNA binding protein